MNISLKFKDTDEKRVLNAFDAAYGGRGEEVSKKKWVKLQVVKFVKQVVEGHEFGKAQAAMEAEAVDKVKKLEVE